MNVPGDIWGWESGGGGEKRILRGEAKYTAYIHTKAT
jgi:hypothetical protein